MKKVVFLGTSYFARQILEYLVDSDYHLVLVVCQPEKNNKNKSENNYSPVKQFCHSNNLPVFQPINIKEEYSLVLQKEPDIIISCAYGQFLPKVLIDYGVLNIHPSLLPQYRGGAPMHKALINGDKETGVSLVKSTLKMDSGPVYKQSLVEILDTDTLKTLTEKLIINAVQLLRDNLDLIIEDKIEPVKQDENKVSWAFNIKAKDELINFDEPYNQVYNHIRALIDWPIGYGVIASKKLKLHSVKKTDLKTEASNGEVVGFNEEGMLVACDKRLLIFGRLQFEGKKVMEAGEFYNGQGRKLVGLKFNET